MFKTNCIFEIKSCQMLVLTFVGVQFLLSQTEFLQAQLMKIKVNMDFYNHFLQFIPSKNTYFEFVMEGWGIKGRLVLCPQMQKMTFLMVCKWVIEWSSFTGSSFLDLNYEQLFLIRRWAGLLGSANECCWDVNCTNCGSLVLIENIFVL